MIHFANNLRIKRKDVLGWTQAKAAREISRQYKQNAIDEKLNNVTDKKLLKALDVYYSKKHNVTKDKYNDWERGKSRPDIEVLRAIIEAFNVYEMYEFLYFPTPTDLTDTDILRF